MKSFDIAQSQSEFAVMNLASGLLAALEKAKFTKPTSVQSEAIAYFGEGAMLFRFIPPGWSERSDEAVL